MSGNHNIRLIFHKTSKANIKLQQFTIMKNKLSGFLALIFFCISFQAHSDQLLTDDYIVQGSICVGLDCVNGENFNFDTIRLKENNVRIRFVDSSSTGSFPSNDWQLTANDSTNGGLNKFSIEDIDGSKVPFTITAGAPTNSIFVTAAGNVGFKTSTPLVEHHLKDGNSPTLRLEQDGSSGFTSQTWDVAGNETNFFIRDVTNGGSIPFRIQPQAPNGSIYVAADGDVGFETVTPDGQFDVAHSTDANNHAFLISSTSNVGVNIDNGFLPLGLFDVQTTGGVSRFLVKSDGSVGIGAGSSGAINGRFEVKSLDANSTYFNVDASGDVGIGTAAPVGRFEIKSTDGATSYFGIDAAGKVGIGVNAPQATFDITKADATMLLRDTTVPSSSELRTLLKLQSHFGNQMHLKADNSTRDWYVGTSKSGNSFLITQHTSSVERNKYNFTNGQIVITDSSSGSSVTTFNFDGTNLTVNGTVNGVSSRTAKDNIIGVDEGDILDKLSSLAIKKWNYIADGDGIKHIGPIAEDFYGLFGLGIDEKHIATLDLSGVAIAGIQALNAESKQKNTQLQQQLEEVKLENKLLSDKLHNIEMKLQSLLNKEQ